MKQYGQKKVLLTNSTTSLLVQVMAVLSSFVVPRCILGSYGSVVNGTIESITGFLGFLTLMEAGVGSVARAALYRCVPQGDTYTTSIVVNETKRFFQRVALIYLAFTVVLAAVFPLRANNGQDFLFNATLVLIIAIVHLVQYYFGAGYIQVLYADQKLYLLNRVQALAYFLNMLVVALCAKLGTSVHVMKLASSAAFLLKPLFVNIYVRWHYHIQRKARQKEPVLTQKWNNLLQTVAYFVHTKTDVVVLTAFTDKITVSVYSVYALITTGLTSIIASLCNGFYARLGNLFGRGEQESLMETFVIYDHFLLNLVLVIFSTASMTILDFVKVYTSTVHDANYAAPLFGTMLVIAEALYCLRLSYNHMVTVAGHFKQTQNGALVEALMNIVLSVILVSRWGLDGVAVGTICAMLYRTLYFVVYLSRHILHYSLLHFLRKVGAILVAVVVSRGLWTVLSQVIVVKGYGTWCLEAVLAGFCAVAGVILANLIFYRHMLRTWKNFLKK